ncbi:phage major capsid protein [Isoptericola sp. NPDC056578]|uniref:phage major capsid protein n=1 Tax=Isoptericola sp. NPDC056578 TaxID=3345870 RepID=UPI0036AA2DA3
MTARKAVIMAVETTVTSAKAWAPDIFVFDPGDVVPDSLPLLASTVLGSIEGDEPVVRVAYVDDAEADFVAEGTEIPEADPALDEVEIATGKVATLVHLSRELYVQNGTATNLATSVQRAVTTKANAVFLAQPAPASGKTTPPAGLLNVPGIVDGGAVSGSLDALADAVATVETAGGIATTILASPLAWSGLRKLKAGTDSNASLLGAGTQDAERYLLGVPVIVTAAMPDAGLMIYDRSAVVSAVGQVLVATSEHVFFTSDGIALRATWRFGQNVVRPDRVVKLTVGSTSGS